MELSQEKSLMSSDPSTKGFDLSAGTKWIYPLNYQFREYQYQISKNALFSNTLVCLPTGLGKTLIAAVVMYNFWRWYPRGKIVFLAPTKPLVTQQISACHDIMGIPSSDTVELTGSMNPSNRKVAWFKKRVIFATPQVFQNDLETNIAPSELVRCVVIDEAHKALGKHAYCESLRLLQSQNSCYRVLALSATPGSKIDNVCQVVKNLYISNLELRDETSPDIIPYLNKRQVDIILVPLDDDLARFKERYVSIMDHYVKILVKNNALKGNTSTISKGRMYYLLKEFQAKTDRPRNYGHLMSVINRCMSLYHAYELLVRHGLRAFATFCQNHSADTWMSQEAKLQELLNEILLFLGPFPDVTTSPDGSIQEIPNDVVFGHTKFYKLKELLLEHFNKFSARCEETRAIVFVEYRDSVNEVYISLLQLKPTLRPKMFVGQAGQKRKQQMQAMNAFRNNEANVLISTSVGEEGLDVGEVDLIICFDVSQSSPIRLVQRMGRTGRRRDGRIVMLVTDGKEHQALKSTISKRDSLKNKVLHSSNIISALYRESPRMIPLDLNPECSKIHIVLHPKTPGKTGKRKRKEMENNEMKNPPNESKKKPAVMKKDAVSHSEVEKIKSTQSSILQFLKKSNANETCPEATTQISQPNSLKKSDVLCSQSDPPKLFTSDTVAVEFLTLCAIKASKREEVRNESNRMIETYIISSSPGNAADFFDNLDPNLDTLDQISSLKFHPRCSTPSTSSEKLDDFDNDIYIPEHAQLNPVENNDSNSLPAVGGFNYENLFDDSCESDKTNFSENEATTKFDETIKKLPKNNEESHKYHRGEQVNNNKDEILQNEEDHRYMELLEDDYFDDPKIFECLPDKVLDEGKTEHEEKYNFVNKGCFESILDESSDSDISTSQKELDSKIYTRKVTTSFTNYTASENSHRVDIIRNIEKPSTSSVSNIRPKNKNKTDQFMEDTSNTASASTGKLVKKTINLTNSGYENVKKNIVKALDEDDDVIFIEKVLATPEQSKNRKKSIDNSLNELKEDDDDDDESVFEEEIMNTSCKNLNKPNANSSVSTIKEILELIENCSSHKTNSNKVHIRTQDLPNPNKTNLVSMSMNTCLKKNSLIQNEKTQINKSDNENTVVSHYFSQVNHTSKNSNIASKTDASPKADPDIDLSDIVWEDDFRNDMRLGNCSTTSARSDQQFNEFSVNTNNTKSMSDERKTSSSTKKKELFKTNLDGFRLFSPKTNIQTEKSPLKTEVDNNLEEFYWESDFEIPENPLKSIKQVSKPEKMSSLSNFKNTSALGSSSIKLSSNFRQSNAVSNPKTTFEQKLSTKKSNILKPSTSTNYFEDDSDFEDDFFQKGKGKCRTGKNINLQTNFALITNKKGLSKNYKSVSQEKENIEPNFGYINLSEFSATHKDRGVEKVSSDNRQKIASSDHYQTSRPKKNKKIPTFLDYEAELSSDTSRGSSGEDCDLDGFVSHTQQEPETVDMKGYYLNSIKNFYNPGVFHFKKPRVFVPDSEVFSQAISDEENNTYVNDSFCVSSSEDDLFTETCEDSFLDLTKKSGKPKKRKRLKNGKESTVKKRKICRVTHSSSSEDETEKLRKEILEESMLLKRRNN